MNKLILYNGKKERIACDENCNKAWGIVVRPKIQLSDDEDDTVYLSDLELGLAPIDPGTYECDCAKPIDANQIPNKWCVRQCERSCLLEEGQSLDSLVDFSKRVYNQPWKHAKK
jgi:hypothetical protein